jgi:hypothetical protein
VVPVPDNPFAALTLIVAPAVLTNATSILTFVTSNRYIVLLDRWRTVAGDIDELPDSDERRMRVSHVDRLERRAQMLLRGLRGLFLTIGMFAISALTALIGASLSANKVADIAAFPMVALATGTIGVISLLYALSQLGLEATLSATHVRDEAHLLKVRGAHPHGSI